MKLTEIVRLYGKYLLLGLIILLVLIALQRGCRLHYLENEYISLKSKYDLLAKQADVALKQALEYIKTQDVRISDQNEIITAKDKEIAEKYGNIDSLNGKLSKLKEVYSTLTDKDAKIANLESQIVDYWDIELGLNAIIADKDAQLSSWKLKFDAQVGISDTWKRRFEDEHALRLVAEQALKVQEKRISYLRFGSNFKSIAIVAIGGYLAYDLLLRRK